MALSAHREIQQDYMHAKQIEYEEVLWGQVSFWHVAFDCKSYILKSSKLEADILSLPCNAGS